MSKKAPLPKNSTKIKKSIPLPPIKQKYIESPEKLWELFKGYKHKTFTNPRHNYVLNVKSGEMVAQALRVPLTMEGFRVYCADAIEIMTVRDYFDNKDGRYEAYAQICTRIKDEIRQDQIEGGMVGQYNASLTARINGLKESTDVTTQGEKLTGSVVIDWSNKVETDGK